MRGWRRDLSPAAVSAGLLASLVGFASSFAIILQGLRAASATEAQAASGPMALSVAMGVCGVALGMRTRMPVGVAWPTPGAMLLASSANVEGDLSYAVAEPDAQGEAALVTFLVSASGMTVLGIGGAAWGLWLAGRCSHCSGVKAASGGRNGCAPADNRRCDRERHSPAARRSRAPGS